MADLSAAFRDDHPLRSVALKLLALHKLCEGGHLRHFVAAAYDVYAACLSESSLRDSFDILKKRVNCVRWKRNLGIPAADLWWAVQQAAAGYDERIAEVAARPDVDEDADEAPIILEYNRMLLQEENNQYLEGYVPGVERLMGKIRARNTSSAWHPSDAHRYLACAMSLAEHALRTGNPELAGSSWLSAIDDAPSLYGVIRPDWGELRRLLKLQWQLHSHGNFEQANQLERLIQTGQRVILIAKDVFGEQVAVSQGPCNNPNEGKVGRFRI